MVPSGPSARVVTYGPPDGPYDFDYVAGRLARAGYTLQILVVSGLRPAPIRSCMPTPEGSVCDDRRPAPPNPRAITEMDQALSWISLIPDDQVGLRKLVQARALCRPSGPAQALKPLYAWKVLGDWLGCSEVTAKTWWVGAIEMIVRRLNDPLFCQRPAFQRARNGMGALRPAVNKAAVTRMPRKLELEEV